MKLRAILAALAMTLAGCGGGSVSGPLAGGGTDGGTTTQPRSGGTLQRADSTTLAEHFRAVLAKGLSRGTFATASVVDSAGGVILAAEAAAEYSATNLQESGVDEADLVKSDGRFIYALVRPETATVGLETPQTITGTATATTPYLRVLQAGADVTEVKRVTLGAGDNARGEGLYLDETRSQLAVLASSGGAVWSYWFVPPHWRQQHTDLAMVDIKTPASAAIAKRFDFDGQLVASRRVGQMLYLVLRSYPMLAGLVDYPQSDADIEKNRQLLAAKSAEDFLPRYRHNGNDAGLLVKPADCFVNPGQAMETGDVITLVALDLAALDASPETRCYAGGSEALYASTGALYLASTRYAYATGASPVYASSQISADVHKFALAGKGLDYRGSAEVKGHLGWKQDAKSFRFGEHDGKLRMITFTGDKTNASPVSLTILDEDPAELRLRTVSTLPNERRPQAIGLTGEQLYASRFIGTKGFLVTFRVTDPLYVLDLADPADPRIAGELKVDGYSDYLHPVSDTLLLGVGKDAVPDTGLGDGRGAWYQGVKLSLIDISNPASPLEADRVVLGKRGTDSNALWEHHGFTWLAPAGGNARAALSLRLHDRLTVGTAVQANTYYQWTNTGLARFEVDTVNRKLIQLPALEVENWAVNGFFGVIDDDRSVIIGDRVHYQHNGQFWSQDWKGAGAKAGPR